MRNELNTSIVFCDDAREEKSGKMTLVGLYSSDCIVQQFPAVFPKIFAVIELRTTTALPDITSLDIEVSLNKKTHTQSIEIPRQFWESTDPVYCARYVFEVPQLQVDSPTSFVVNVIANGEQLATATLNIKAGA